AIKGLEGAQRFSSGLLLGIPKPISTTSPAIGANVWRASRGSFLGVDRPPRAEPGLTPATRRASPGSARQPAPPSMDGRSGCAGRVMRAPTDRGRLRFQKLAVTVFVTWF